MHILHIITKAECGGAQIHLLGLALRQIRQGHRVHVLCGDDGFLMQATAAAGAQTLLCPELIHPIRPLHDARALLQIKKRIRALQPDLVHAHSSKAGLLARLACKIARIPCVFTAHGWAFSEGAPFARASLALVAEWLAAKTKFPIIDVSNYDRALALRKRVGNVKQHYLVHNGLPDWAGAQQAKAPPVVTMVARFAPPKRQELLLQAWGYVKQGNHELRLVGDGPMLAECQRLAATLDQKASIHFAGNSATVNELLQQSCIFALLSNHEGLPLTIIEAMRAGLPVVASAVGGVPELVEDGVTGYLVPRQASPQQIAAVLQKLVDDPQLAQRMGAAGRQRYLERFTEDAMMTKIDVVYAAALRRSR